ncbi:hypothetical protein M8J75_016625 [Diaphorina citri]|nr:hypothetical protein M8J75_016625 [Diaphorina citri]KAI5754372.1 hypothetical protein M8J77_008101 [Diaphorina citri]
MVDTSTYLYNSLLVKSLLKLTPIRERAYAWDWIAMLDGLTKSDTELCIRSDYVWYLLKCLECGNVSEPFNEVPPTRSCLKPLVEVLPTIVYEEVVKKSTPSMNWLDQLACVDVLSEVEQGVCPGRFLASQPIPRYGTICYGCVFGPQPNPPCV